MLWIAVNVMRIAPFRFQSELKKLAHYLELNWDLLEDFL